MPNKLFKQNKKLDHIQLHNLIVRHNGLLDTKQNNRRHLLKKEKIKRKKRTSISAQYISKGQ